MATLLAAAGLVGCGGDDGSDGTDPTWPVWAPRGDNDGKAWCGQDGLWSGLPSTVDHSNEMRIVGAQVPCAETTGVEAEDCYCVTEADASDCTFAYERICETGNHRIRCEFQVSSATTMSGTCVQAAFGVMAEDAVSATWVSE